MLLLNELGRSWLGATLGLALALCGCGGDDASSPGVLSRFDVSADAGPFDAPFPIAHRARPDGSLRIGDFPNPSGDPWLSELVDVLEGGRNGFSLNGGIWLPFEGPVDVGRLPKDPNGSTSADSPVFLVAISPEAERYGERLPIEVAFRTDEQAHSPANLLVVLPYQGVVLQPETTYAVVVRRGLGDGDGKPLFAAETLDVLLRGDTPAGPEGARLAEAFGTLRTWLAEEGIAPTDVASATVFSTGDPREETIAWQQQVAAADAPAITDAVLEDTYEHHCVIRAKTTLPVFQRGPKPYTDLGTGQIVVDGDGALVEQERDTVELVFTIPKTTMPDEGFPLVLYAADAGGGARQVVDEASGDEGGGSGPARYYGARGIGSLGYPGPLTGERHPGGDGDGADAWRTANLTAFRDNVRQAVLDVTTLVRISQGVTFDPALCPEATSSIGSLRYDPDALVIHGHGVGGVVGGVATALEDAVSGVVLSGVGGSWIAAVSLADSRPDEAIPSFSEQVTDSLGFTPERFDPALTLLQTALESIEVMSWGRTMLSDPLPGHDPKHVLLVHGARDSDHVPRMVNAYAMSMGLDLMDPELIAGSADDYELVGRSVLPPPLKGNVDRPSGDVTAVTVQHEPAQDEGHDVAFELDPVRYQYGCFVDTLVKRDLPTVPAPNDDPFDDCP